MADQVTRVTIYNVTMTSANTEYSLALPTNVQKALVKVRSGAADIKLAYLSGTSGTTYITIPAGSSKYLEGAWLNQITLYFQSDTAAQVLEVEAWQ